MVSKDLNVEEGVMQILAHEAVLLSDKLLEDDDIVMETRVTELNCRECKGIDATTLASIDDTTCVDRHPPHISPVLSTIVVSRDGLIAESPTTVVESTTPYPTYHSPRKWQRYTLPGPSPFEFINKNLQCPKTVLRFTN